MKQVVSTNRGEVYVRDAPSPVLGSSGAVVRTICSIFGEGSELGQLRRIRQAIVRGERLPDGPVVERPMSYQSSGRIVELSPDLAGSFAVGDVVAAAGAGFGNHAEYGFVPRNTMARVPEGLSPVEAATCNIGLTALHTLRRASFQAGELMVVIGLGMVGQILAQLVAALGGRAIGTDRLPLRLDIARSCGIEAALSSDADALREEVARRSGGLGADSVALCVGSAGPDLMHLAVRLVRPGGVILLVGGPIYPDFTGADGDASPHLKEIDLRWVYGRGPGSRDPAWNRGEVDYPARFVRWTARTNLEALLDLQARGSVRVAPLITHRFPVEKAGDAASLLIEHPDQALGVALTYGERTLVGD